MPKPCSQDLRERVLEAVETGASRREAAERFEVSPAFRRGRAEILNYGILDRRCARRALPSDGIASLDRV